MPLNFQISLAARAAAQAPPNLLGRDLAMSELHEPSEIEPIRAPACAAGMKSQPILEVLAYGVDDDHLHVADRRSSGARRSMQFRHRDEPG